MSLPAIRHSIGIYLSFKGSRPQHVAAFKAAEVIRLLMHRDLIEVSNVWQCDARIDALRAEHEELNRTIKAADQAVLLANSACTEAERALAAAKDADRANTRELDSYTEKRNSTRQMINTGTAPDYALAERQLANVAARIDALENTGLELIDVLESAQARLKSSETDRRDAEAALSAAKADLSAKDGPIRKELGEILPRREAAWEQMHPELKPMYLDQRRKKKRALVNVVEKTCSVCSTFVPPQVWLDTDSGKESHRCTGCGGWILP